MANQVRKIFMLVGLLKYGIVLSLLLIYLPLTALDRVPFTKGYQLPGHDITGNMFIELSVVGVLLAMIFLLAVAWSIMFTEGLIVNGVESRFPESQAADQNRPQADKQPAQHRRAYRRQEEIKQNPSSHIPAWADVFFAIPVTGWQFLAFTILLAGPSFAVIVWQADKPIVALAMGAVAFVIDYVAFIALCTPVAVIDPSDPPLRGFPLAKAIWSWLGYRRRGRLTGHERSAMSAAHWAHRLMSSIDVSLDRIRLCCISWLTLRRRVRAGCLCLREPIAFRVAVRGFQFPFRTACTFRRLPCL